MKYFPILFLLLLSIMFSCNREKHFLIDKDYREQVLKDFEQTKELAKGRSNELFSVFENDLSLEESEALKFLYAYMPLNDLADYNGDFYLKNVRLAFQARDTFSWGKEIPNDIFRHYVLPHRVNNENLDTARSVFFNELKERLKGLSLEQAALEVNHWCHEKVVYQPTSRRTISPLNAVKSAFGRCGEESTFAVTALRAACIPARQCYTPRWAHVDDNHAWVEVWIDGKWHYMGACEPEPKLNVAWFDEPVLRAMLVHSKAFGLYKGNERVLKQHQRYAEMNLIENYTESKTIAVKTLNAKGQILPNASVEFQLYNYAEFYPLAIKKTDENGICSFTTGLGDLLIWAYDENYNFNYKKITVTDVDTLVLTLANNKPITINDSLNIKPPRYKKAKVTISKKEKELNEKRLHDEDSIRNAYVNTFIPEEKVKEVANELGINADKSWKYVKQSRGNWPDIMSYLKQGTVISKAFTLKQLEAISKKDLRDIKADILINNLEHSLQFFNNTTDTALFVENVLNPRIAHEILVDYKPFLYNHLVLDNGFSIENLVKWIEDSISTDKENNYYNVPLSPKGVFELKVSDVFSKELFFVAACRSFGVPARFQIGTNRPEYYDGKDWKTVSFREEKEISNSQGYINLVKDESIKTDLKYRIHYSIAQLSNGRYNTLDYGWEIPFDKMKNPLVVDEGKYMLLTGTRKVNGSVISRLNFFDVLPEETSEIIVSIEESVILPKPLSRYINNDSLKDINDENIFLKKPELYVISWLDINMEPTKHVLNDLQNMADDFNKQHVEFYFMIDEKEKEEVLKYNLPENSRFIVDKDMKVFNDFKSKTKLDNNHQLPATAIIANSNVYYFSAGYTIGIGEQLLNFAIKYNLSND
jgi:transglutaminase-like putative cysteine protease